MPPAPPPHGTGPSIRAAGDPWFPEGARGAPVAAPGALPLVCFPYAGGTPSVFHRWTVPLGPSVRVTPLQLPGRGLRLREESFTTMGPLAEAVADALTARGLDADCAFFGHSMGSLLAYEVAWLLRERGRPGPTGLFLSGSRAPHQYGDRADAELPDAELIDLLGDLGGLSGELTAVRQAFLRRRLPALRADLRVCDRYQVRHRPPLTVPITVLAGADDPLATPEQAEAWRSYTTGGFHRPQVPGGHFYLLEEPTRQILLRELREWCAGLAACPPARIEPTDSTPAPASAPSADPAPAGPCHTPRRYAS